MRHTLLLSALAVIGLTGCPGGNNNTGGGGGGGSSSGGGSATGGGSASQGGGTTAQGGGSAAGGGSAQGGGAAQGPVLPKPSRSTAIDLTSDDALILAVNPDNDSLSVVTTNNNTRGATVSFPAGSMPVSVVINPNNTEAYVVLRKAQKLVKVTGINTLNPAVDTAQATVGSEPTGVALSPTGATAIVTNFGEDSVTVVTTSSMAVSQTLHVGPSPRAVAITNNLDMNDADEKAYVTLFYGAPSAEASDTGRTGKVVPIPLGSLTPGTAISLAPIADTGFEIDGGTTTGVSCSPNQLYGIAIDSGKVYVSHVCVAPHGPVQPLTNVFAGLSVIDTSNDTEVTGPLGSQALSKLLGTNGTLLGIPIALDFKAPGIAYLVSQAADAVQRIAIDTGGNRWCLGNCTSFAQIDIGQNGGTAGTAVKAAIGIVSAHSTTKTQLYTNNWIDRSVSVVELSGTQQVTSTVRSENLPTAGNADFAPWSGKKLYFTGTGRWALRGVNSCGSCHPDGLSDNMTWVFAAGPRQTVPMDGTFSKSGPLEQRALNWTAIFDEIHDFEGNTRGTAGGVGALVSDATLAPASRLDLALAQSIDGGLVPPGNFTRNDNLSGSARQLMVFKSALQSWDQIDAFSQTIHANKAPTGLDGTDIAAGRALFQSGKCQNCHGGAKWTTSRVSFTPSPDKNGTATAFTDAGIQVGPNGLRTQALSGSLNFSFAVNRDTNKIAAEARTDGGAAVGPERITCVLRDVRTFDFTDPVEKKADGTVSQGANGFNPPSLFGLATSAPYMHNGGAADLDTVLTASKFNAHLTSANQNFSLTATEVRQLKTFLLSIDEATSPIAPDSSGTDICAGY